MYRARPGVAIGDSETDPCSRSGFRNGLPRRDWQETVNGPDITGSARIVSL